MLVKEFSEATEWSICEIIEELKIMDVNSSESVKVQRALWKAYRDLRAFWKNTVGVAEKYEGNCCLNSISCFN